MILCQQTNVCNHSDLLHIEARRQAFRNCIFKLRRKEARRILVTTTCTNLEFFGSAKVISKTVRDLFALLSKSWASIDDDGPVVRFALFGPFVDTAAVPSCHFCHSCESFGILCISCPFKSSHPGVKNKNPCVCVWKVSEKCILHVAF